MALANTFRPIVATDKADKLASVRVSFGLLFKLEIYKYTYIVKDRPPPSLYNEQTKEKRELPVELDQWVLHESELVDRRDPNCGG